MPIPTSERIEYATNPIIEVICQLNFPTILKIDSELPVNYQERIRDQYPNFQESRTKIDFSVTNNKQSDTEEQELPTVPSKTLVSFSFGSEDGTRKVVLTREFLAFTTINYVTWTDFESWFEGPLRIFVDIYKPSFFSRIGLRYKDLIVRSKLNLSDVSWNDLLRPEIAGEIGLDELKDEVVGKSSQAVFRLADESTVVLNHGLVKNLDNEYCYLIDSDTSTTERTEANDAFNKLTQFNKSSGNLFRRCISEVLRDALGKATK